MKDLKAEFDRYVQVSTEIDSIKNCEIERLQGVIDQMETTIQLMERSLNNKEK
jgi:hypothetical protein